MALRWTDWQPLPLVVAPHVLAETLDGGQSFRWIRQPEGAWLGVWSDHVAQLSLGQGNQLQWRAPESRAHDTDAALRRYLGLDRDVDALTDSLPWRSDAHLAQCVAAFPRLRILQQPFGETLLCFLCSATKQIVQIKQMTALLAERHGARLAPGFHRLPTWPELAAVPERALRDCLLGFRARFIHETALFLEQNPGWLTETEAAPYAAAKERLCTLPGVGEKVADCVLLFGGRRLEAFPVDVWILRTMATRYGLTGWRPAQIAQFGRTHFGPLAGLAQQFLFAYERQASAAAKQRRS